MDCTLALILRFTGVGASGADAQDGEKEVLQPWDEKDTSESQRGVSDSMLQHPATDTWVTGEAGQEEDSLWLSQSGMPLMALRGLPSASAPVFTTTDPCWATTFSQYSLRGARRGCS